MTNHQIAILAYCWIPLFIAWVTGTWAILAWAWIIQGTFMSLFVGKAEIGHFTEEKDESEQTR